jgi:hypothetical protein
VAEMYLPEHYRHLSLSLILILILILHHHRR